MRTRALAAEEGVAGQALGATVTRACAAELLAPVHPARPAVVSSQNSRWVSAYRVFLGLDGGSSDGPAGCSSGCRAWGRST